MNSATNKIRFTDSLFAFMNDLYTAEQSHNLIAFMECDNVLTGLAEQYEPDNIEIRGLITSQVAIMRLIFKVDNLINKQFAEFFAEMDDVLFFEKNYL